MPTLAVDPTYPSLSTVGVRKQFDYLEVSFKPTSGSAVTWERIPMVSELGAYAPSIATSELPLFVDSGGSTTTLRATQDNGGTIPFATAAHATDALLKKLLSAAKNGTPVVFKAHYQSLEVTIQGQGTIGDRGMQGDATAIPTWAFDLNVITADYVGPDGNYINK